MKEKLIMLLSGLLFGLGLSLSQMIDRNRVLGFLDVTGDWDATLLFVLGGAVGVTFITFRFILRLPRPIIADKFYLPSTKDVDLSLVMGAAIFGVGWGIGGYCPGPAITSLVLKSFNPILFTGSFIVGSLVHQAYSSKGDKTK